MNLCYSHIHFLVTFINIWGQTTHKHFSGESFSVCIIVLRIERAGRGATGAIEGGGGAIVTHVIVSLTSIRKIVLQTPHVVQRASHLIHVVSSHGLVGGEGIVLGSDLVMLLHASSILNIAKWLVLIVGVSPLVVGLVP